MTAGLVETKRNPFDLPEGEAEIVGYFIEYSGLKWGVFMLVDFLETVLIGALATLLFFGGWQVPFLHADGFHFGNNVIIDGANLGFCSSNCVIFHQIKFLYVVVHADPVVVPAFPV